MTLATPIEPRIGDDVGNSLLCVSYLYQTRHYMCNVLRASWGRAKCVHPVACHYDTGDAALRPGFSLQRSMMCRAARVWDGGMPRYLSILVLCSGGSGLLNLINQLTGEQTDIWHCQEQCKSMRHDGSVGRRWCAKCVRARWILFIFVCFVVSCRAIRARR